MWGTGVREAEWARAEIKGGAGEGGGDERRGALLGARLLTCNATLLLYISTRTHDTIDCHCCSSTSVHHHTHIFLLVMLCIAIRLHVHLRCAALSRAVVSLPLSTNSRDK